MSTQRRAGEAAEDAGEAASSADSGLLATAAPPEVGTAAGVSHSVLEGYTLALSSRAHSNVSVYSLPCETACHDQTHLTCRKCLASSFFALSTFYDHSTQHDHCTGQTTCTATKHSISRPSKCSILAAGACLAERGAAAASLTALAAELGRARDDLRAMLPTVEAAAAEVFFCDTLATAGKTPWRLRHLITSFSACFDMHE